MVEKMSCTWTASSLEYKKQSGPASSPLAPIIFTQDIQSHSRRKLD